MNWKRMKVIAAVPVALAVTAGAVQLGISYRNGNGFHPFGTDRKMKNNQILFPDSQESTGKQTDQTGEDDSSFLEKEEDKAQQGNSSDNLFDGEDTSNPENRPTGALAQGDGAAAGTADSANGGPIGVDGVYDGRYQQRGRDSPRWQYRKQRNDDSRRTGRLRQRRKWERQWKRLRQRR